MTPIEQYKVDVDRMYQSLTTLAFSDAVLFERLRVGYEEALAQLGPEHRDEAIAFRDRLHRTYFPERSHAQDA